VLGTHQVLTVLQLVVVGDQSSGKSSLLESLSGIPFLKDSSLCTRHATQITSRRDDKESVKINIIAGPHAPEDHKKTVEGWTREITSTMEFRNQFVEILKQVSEATVCDSEEVK
jgi:GTPase SAR1 family protein